MKRLLVLILIWTLLVITGTLVSANGQTRFERSGDVINNQITMSGTLTEANAWHTMKNTQEEAEW